MGEHGEGPGARGARYVPNDVRPLKRPQAGFTLTELMVVVSILGVLMAVAIPTFTAVIRASRDRAAQASVMLGLRAERAFYVDDDRYSEDPQELEGTEASLGYDGPSGGTCEFGVDGPRCVWVQLVTAQEVLLVARSGSGTYWGIRDTARPAPGDTYFNAGGSAAQPAPSDVDDRGW